MKLCRKVYYKQGRRLLFITASVLLTTYLFAQDGNAGINDANTKVRTALKPSKNTASFTDPTLRLPP